MTRNISFFLLVLLALPASLFSQVSFSAVPRQGCDTLTVQYTYTGSLVPATIVWRFGNGDTSHRINPLPVFYDSPGMYNVSVTVNGTTSALESQFIKVRAVPAANFVYSDTLVPGSFNYVFRALPQPVDTASYAFDWIFLDDNSTASTRFVLHQYDSAGLYLARLIVTDDFGCADTLTRRVNVSEKIIVPNVFTPNGDAINESFVLPVNGLTTYDFRIYSRYGILLYKAVSKFPGWDGTNSAGIFMNSGVYYYTLQSLDPEKPLNQSGFIHLFRD